MSHREDHGQGDGVDDWCSVAEAARRLGVTPTAIRNRIRRGTLRTRPNGNHGHLVRVPQPVPLTVTGTVSTPEVDTVSLTVSEPSPSPVEIALRERIADLDGRAEELRSDLDLERRERVRDREERLEERRRAERLGDEVAALARELARVVEEAGDRERELRDRVATLIDARSRPWWRRLAG